MLKKISIFFICFSLCFQGSSYADSCQVIPTGVPNVIFDSDVISDQGDAGAIGLLNALADNGEARILAVLSHVSVYTSIYLEQIYMYYYGRTQVPFGITKDTDSPLNVTDKYGVYINTNYKFIAGADAFDDFPDSAVPNAVTVYRKVLAGQPDASVTIISVGLMRNIYNLYNSPADSISPLTGAQLLQAKVAKLVIMGGDYPSSGSPEYNFTQDKIGLDVINSIADNLTIEVGYVGFTFGNNVFIDATASSMSSPIRDTYVHGWANFLSRQAWDELAVLYAVRGLTFAGDTYFVKSSTGKNSANTSTGHNTFTAGAGTQYYLTAGSLGTSGLGTVMSNLINRDPLLLDSCNVIKSGTWIG